MKVIELIIGLSFFLSGLSLLSEASEVPAGHSQGVSFINRYYELNLRKKVSSILKKETQKNEMKEKVERILRSNQEGESSHWWTYSDLTGDCMDAQMELREYLRFLKQEKAIFALKEDKTQGAFMVDATLPDEGKERSYWTKDRYSCEQLVRKQLGSLKL